MRHMVWAGVVALALLAGCAGKAWVVEEDGGAVRFHLSRPEAARVELVASANGYAPVPAARDEDGTWTAEVPDAGDGFAYFFLVDGQAYTPPCELSRPDGFGGRTCLFDPGM